MSTARNSALPAAIDYLIEIGIEFDWQITTIKPAEKGSNQLQSILLGQNSKSVLAVFWYSLVPFKMH